MQITQKLAHLKRGRLAEETACTYLKQQGLRLIRRNFQCRTGEIDLIMQDKHTLVFIEVRYRNHSRYGNGFDSITLSKQHKLLRTAAFYLQYRWERDRVKTTLPKWTISRFDAVSVAPHHEDITKMVCRWIKQAFTSDSPL